MLTLDLSHGGGQLARFAVALACLKSVPIHLTNIRAARPNPGLRPQHIAGIEALTSFCFGKTTGLSVGSAELIFEPGKSLRGKLEISIPTAGSVGLVLQATMIAAIDHPLALRIHGGSTASSWSPPLNYINSVINPLLSSPLELEVSRHGYYPKGGAEVTASVSFCRSQLALETRGKLVSLDAVITCSESLRTGQVAERIAAAAAKTLSAAGLESRFHLNHVQTLNPGCDIVLAARCENSVIGTDALGAPGKPAEEVGREAASKLLAELASNAAVDSHAADQLLPYLAIFGGSITIPAVTPHVQSSLALITRILEKEISIDGSGPFLLSA